MKISKISLRQGLAKAIMDRQGLKSWDIETFRDDDLIVMALIELLRNEETKK
jgi:hypothetical protein